MRILADYHHNGLFHSFQLIVNKLDYQLFAPYGRQWYREGFWGVGEPYNFAPDVVKQYLGDNDEEEKITRQWIFQDDVHNCSRYAISLEEFKNTKFDVIICSISQHIKRFKDLRDKYQPQAKLIWQQGNPGYLVPDLDAYPNIMDSVGQIENSVKGTNYIKYHQPFELDVFHPVNKCSERYIRSFVLSMEQLDLWLRIRANSRMDINFNSYGYKVHGADHLPISGIKNIAERMQNSRAGWHVKSVDGYGHIIHNWFACGQPVFTFFSQYDGKLARDLMLDGQTAFDLGVHSEQEIISIIKNLCFDDNYYFEISSEVQCRFKEIVNFDKEAEQLKIFFENLI